MPPQQQGVLANPKRPVEMCLLSNLEFDLSNPRYGTSKDIGTEREALNHIVKTFGVEDVLSSIAVNGFFDSEPLIGIRTTAAEPIKIVEGNRRLAACLILAGDPRAIDQAKLTQTFQVTRLKHHSPTIDPVPVIIYEGPDAQKDVLPFIGVRHIRGFLEWDSFAKASWVDQILDAHKLTLADITEMLGDNHGTIRRMLAGFRFVDQLIREGHFKPNQSQRRGRGSNLDYPFSWVYTALDNPPIKAFVGLQDVEVNGVTPKNPIPEDKLEDAGWVMTFMFGDRHRGIAAVVEDSRDIGDLSRALKNPLLYSRLKDGVKLSTVIEESKPTSDRLQEGIQRISEYLKEVAGLVVPGQLTPDEAMKLLPSAQLVAHQARKIAVDVKKIAINEDADLLDLFQ